MEDIYLKALDLANYEIDDDISLETQFRNMFLDMVDGGIYSDITCEDEANDYIEEIGLEKVAKILVRKMKNYHDFKELRRNY